MTPLPLSRKIEKLITAYISTLITGGVITIYEGHVDAPVLTLPYLIVYAENCVPAPDMPTSIGIRMVSIRFNFCVDSTDTTIGDPRTKLDAWRRTTEGAMADVQSIMDYINAPDTIPDNRSVKDVHIYDIFPTNEPTEFDKTDWIEQVTFDVLCQPLDTMSA